MADRRKGTERHPGQIDLLDWLVIQQPSSNPDTLVISEPAVPGASADDLRYQLALSLAQQLNTGGIITSKFLTAEANRVFGDTQANGAYLSKDAYDALEVAVNLHLVATEGAVNWNDKDPSKARDKVIKLTELIQSLPTQTRRDVEMDEFQQFSTPPTLSFVANWVANISSNDEFCEPSAGTGDLAIWAKMAGANLVLNELSTRRQSLLSSLFPESRVFKENAEQLDNILPLDVKPTVIVMNPPFSSTAGRVHGQRDSSNGARHIEQALKRLENRGRLVGIVGNGMAADKPAFRKWWSDIEQKYNVRANIGISGKEYAKYGTTFDNQIIVIDKTGATTSPILTGKVDLVAELPALLEGIRNDRSRIQSTIDQPASNENTEAKPSIVGPGNGIGGARPDPNSDGERVTGTGRGDNSGAGIVDSEVSGRPGAGHVADDRIGARGRVLDGAVGDVGGSSSGDSGRDSGIIDGQDSSHIVIESNTGTVTEFTDSIFANYTPQRLSIPGAKEHPGKLVQSAAMAAVEPPTPTYAPVLPANVIQDGLLSLAQLETVVYAGQAHSQILPNGQRKGFFVGDGTGVGKGREISGIILDNMTQGRKRAVWVSFNEGLIEDARRDFAGVGGDPSLIFFQGKTKAGDVIAQNEGILFTTYSTLRGGEKKLANDLGQKGGKTRVQQIIDWLGEDFDGVIAFDEAHSMGNAIEVKLNRGVRKPSQQAIAGINLQKALPHSRITYVSATGATEISNLSYADRLGLWGEGAPFANTKAFIENVSKGGIAAMELISRDMKAMGMYLARSLSYDGVTYERLEHTLTPLQKDIYDELAGAWQIVLNNVDQALEITQAGKSGQGKSAAMSQFWGAHQRFFNQIITALQTPKVIDDIQNQLDAGNAVLIQIVNTNEAAQERIIAEATANDVALEDLDFTPRQMLMDYVRNGFPVAAYQETKDSEGNTVYVPVKDSEGNLVFDKEAIKLRDQLLENLQLIRVPENPIDSIINVFGANKVAEVTGRNRRFVQTRDDDGNLKVIEEKRGKYSSRADAEAFQANKKDILIFSGAGGTGYSFHADNTAENRRRRVHYILQPGFRADAAVQGFGRSHRTNQANAPHYVLPTTNLKAQKRFISSIARRLDQLGALTKGQRETTSQGIFSASDNLESQYAVIALSNFFGDLYRGKTDLSFHDITKQMGLDLIDKDSGALATSKIPPIPQFLNRMLSLKTDQQDAVFEEFEKRLIEAVEYAKQKGIYDMGLQTMTALSIKKTRDDVAYEDKATGATTRYVELEVTDKVDYNEWEHISEFAASHKPKKDDKSGWYVSEFGKNKGQVFLLLDIGERLDPEGKPVHRGVVHTINKGRHRYIDNADAIHRGYDYRFVTEFGRSNYKQVTLSKRINESEAESLWKEQLGRAPQTETRTERMIVGVILPIWDRVEGEELIYRLQTDEGEQLLGRMLKRDSAKKTMKNLGLDSDVANMKSSEIFDAIRSGSRAFLANGWEISTARVNNENRIEIKGRGSLTEGDKTILRQQGAFQERISWEERLFIPIGSVGLPIFERITTSRPVVDLIAKSKSKAVDDDYGPEYGINQQTSDPNAEDVSLDLSTNPEVISMSDKKQSMLEKKPYYELVAEKLIAQLEQGTAPWQRPWTAGANDYLPVNPKTGNRYKGINSIHLLVEGRDDPRWMTYNQAQELGGQVRKGEKGTGITYWKFTEEQPKKEHGNPVLDAEGNQVKETVRLERPRAFFAVVFNAEQIDGLPALEKKELSWDPIERAEKILTNSGADISHHQQGKAYYRPLADTIHLPNKELFPTASNYYATALHELGHWTGHSSRLDRDIRHPFGSEGYAKEELRAEISSLMLGGELGIGHDPEQHVAYVGSWIKVLQEDPMEIMRAAAAAEKIQKYVLGLEHQQDQDQTQVNNEQNKVLVEPQSQETNQGANVLKENTSTLEQRGYVFSDPGTDNLGKVGGEVVVIDPGAVSPKETKERIDLNVPFKEKNEAKALGAKWDREQSTWYVPPGVDPEPFAKWHASAKSNADSEDKAVDVKAEPVKAAKTERQYLAVPYEDRDIAKTAGAFWDKQAKSWYVGLNGDMLVLSKFLPQNVKIEQAPAMRPEEEFAEVLRSMGCIVTGDHPIMDGKKHRILVEDDKSKSHNMGAGFYIAHLDGRPNGYVMNNRTQVSTKWVAKGYSLDAAEKAQLAETAAIKLREREAAAAARAKEVAGAVSELLAVAPAAPADHNYLLKKQASPGDLRIVPENTKDLPANTLIMIGADWKESKTLREDNPDKLVFTAGDLLLAGHDINGNITTVQSIQQNGSKCYVKDSHKSGSFHVVGGLEALADVPAIVIHEGYATGDSLSQGLGFATVTAFDSNNLKGVAVALHEKFPDKPIVIAGDDDLNQELKNPNKKNPGKIKAMEAAEAVGGKAIFPIFAPGEQENSPKDFSDFNDLATNSVLGKEGVKRQVKSIVDDVISKSLVQNKQIMQSQQSYVQGQRKRLTAKI